MPDSSGGGVITRRQLRRWLRKRGETRPGRHHGHRGHHRRHGGYYPSFYPAFYPAYYSYPSSSYYDYGYGYNNQAPWWTEPEQCPRPLTNGCSQLNITPRWASSCFLPRYRYLRNVYGADYEALASAIAREEAPDCPFPAQSGAAAEYARRIKLAVAVLLNGDGVPVPYPPSSRTPRPANADSIMQPWMRALLTGWV